MLQRYLLETLKYQTKSEIAADIVRELVKRGFRIKRVLADSLYGESRSNFLREIENLGIEYAVSIRSNHGVWLPETDTVSETPWQSFQHVTWNKTEETRYIREIIYGKRRALRYWVITKEKTDISTDISWYVMTKIDKLRSEEVGHIYGVRSWIEHGFRNSKQELGWADWRVTRYQGIRKWWELVMSAYLMICLLDSDFNPWLQDISDNIQQHPKWNRRKSWKSLLNNLRLIMEPSISFNLIKRWLGIYPISQVLGGLRRLSNRVNEYNPLKYFVYLWRKLHFSSA